MAGVEIVKDIEMRMNRTRSLNRLADISDWEQEGVHSKIMEELREGVYIHRKAWEYAHCIHGLTTLGAVAEDARAIAVGAGHERPLYYFANQIQEMVATDIYEDPEHEGNPEMLVSPEAFAPFPYRHSHLVVRRMSGTDLMYDDSTFDFAFTLSSIEHFGSRDNQKRAMEEMRRVVKPGGVICVATELILNRGTHPEYFTLQELQAVILSNPGLTMVGGDLDLRISRSLFENPIELDVEHNFRVSPHIVLKSGNVIWTSVMMFFRKD